MHAPGPLNGQRRLNDEEASETPMPDRYPGRLSPTRCVRRPVLLNETVATSSRTTVGKETSEMRSTGWMSVFVFLVGGAVVGCAGQTSEPPSPIIEEADSIIGGSTDTGDPGVVAVYGQEPGSRSGFLCTGSVIAPSVIITAAHGVGLEDRGGAEFTVITARCTTARERTPQSRAWQIRSEPATFEAVRPGIVVLANHKR